MDTSLAASRTETEAEIGPGLETSFVDTLRFSERAPGRLVQAAFALDAGRFHRALARVGLPQPGRRRASISAACLQAAGLCAPGGSNSVSLLTRETALALAGNVGRRQLGNHLAALLDAAEHISRLEPPELAAWLTLLWASAGRVKADLSGRLWRRCLQEVRRVVRQFGAAATSASESEPESPEALLADEILFRGGLLFDVLEESEEWRRVARSRWRERLQAEFDKEGLPRRPGPRNWRPLVESLLRVTTDAIAFEQPLWKRADWRRLNRAAEFLAAHVVLAGGVGRSEWKPMVGSLQALCRMSGWRARSEPVRLLSAALAHWEREGDVDATALPTTALLSAKQTKSRSTARRRPGGQSDESRSALLRNHWRADATACVLHYDRPQPFLDLAIRGRACLRGRWGLTLVLDGQPAPLSQGWKCDCWFSDRDADFVELCLELGDGVALTRQILVTRRSSGIVFMDAVRGLAPGRSVELRSTLPLADAAQVEADGFTRELHLVRPQDRVRVFPLTLPPERSIGGNGTLSAELQELVFESRGQGNLCQVLALEYSDARGRRPADWMPLTVAEDGRRLASYEAVAARLRVGDENHVYLHNLTRGQIPRTALGHHTASETVIGYLDADGDLRPYVHVDSEAEDASSGASDSGNSSAASADRV